jgi:hypothetical protein
VCLKTITVPDSVTTIADSAFFESGLTSIIESAWAVTGGLVMRLGKVFCCLARPSSIRIPGSVREIGDGVFDHHHDLVDLSFEEGITRIGSLAFHACYNVEQVEFPASLIVIEASAFYYCHGLRRITFAVGSQLQYIRSEAFASSDLREVVVPASIVEIDPSAFSGEVWRSFVTFTGPPLFLIDDHFLLSLDSRVIFCRFSSEPGLLIGSNIEVIGAKVFYCGKVTSVLFGSGTKLRKIGVLAFACCLGLEAFNVPESLEILDDRCFEDCSNIETIEFEGPSRLKRIGERAFMGCRLRSITIPALTEEIDGSAFANCLTIAIRVAPGNLHFKVEENMLVTSTGAEIVRYFGRDREIVVGKNVRVLRKSCFEDCQHLNRIAFETGSELERIGASALRDCVSLPSIVISSSVTIIEESAFDGCAELESCLIAKDSSLVTIGATAFAKCALLRSFTIPPRVGEINRDCFIGCIYLHRLKFRSSESLKRVLGDRSLDDGLEGIGVTINSGLFRIEVEDGGMELEFPGWTSASVGEGHLHLTLV